MEDLLLCEAVLSELSHEETHLDCVAAKQIGEKPENVHHLLRGYLVVQVKQVQCLSDLVL